MTFEKWFSELKSYAATKGLGDYINEDCPESYREFYDDAVSPQEAFTTELSYAAGDCW